jgi:hypothetical protein
LGNLFNTIQNVGVIVHNRKARKPPPCYQEKVKCLKCEQNSKNGETYPIVLTLHEQYITGMVAVSRIRVEEYLLLADKMIACTLTDKVLGYLKDNKI